jgi:regulator of RNase E activity RraA
MGLKILQIGDALVKLKYPFGGFLDGIRMWSPELSAGPRRVIGPAVTVKMVEVSNTNAPKPSKHFADHNQPGKIMYIQQPKGLYSACWGGLMSTRAKFLGAGGVVVDGRVRDVGEHREFDFPASDIEPLERCLANVFLRYLHEILPF